MKTYNGLLTINGWQGLAQLGINPLTGEACRFSMRILCDLNQDGRELMAEYLGVMPECFVENWNSAVDGKPAVASVMLHRDSFNQVAEFALAYHGALGWAAMAQGVVGAFTKEAVEQLRELLAHSGQLAFLKRNYASNWQPHMGSRNVHAATGRAN